MEKDFFRKFLLQCRTLQQSLRNADGRFSELIRKATARLGNRRLFIPLLVVLFLLALAWGYWFRSPVGKESPPLLIEENPARRPVPPEIISVFPEGNDPTGNGNVTALARLEKEVAELRAQLQELTEKKEEAAAEVFNPTEFSRPVQGRLIRGTGWMRMRNEWRFHPGIDITLPEGSNVLACADGTVSEIRMDPFLGTVIRLEHGSGWDSLYGHVNEVAVSLRQKVKKGMLLGKSSSATCGPEPGIHFALYYQGKAIDPRTVIPGL